MKSESPYNPRSLLAAWFVPSLSIQFPFYPSREEEIISSEKWSINNVTTKQRNSCYEHKRVLRLGVHVWPHFVRAQNRISDTSKEEQSSRDTTLHETVIWVHGLANQLWCFLTCKVLHNIEQ